MVTVNRKDDQQFPAALERFEEALAAPVVPGELEAWVNGACQSLAWVDSLFRRQIAGAHERNIETIAETDPDQLTRVQGLREELDRLREALKELSRLAIITRDLASIKDEGSPGIETNLKSLVDHGMQWIRNSRQHEQAIETWLLEAFHRDRGEGD